MSIQELNLQLFRARLSIEASEKALVELEETSMQTLCLLCEANSLLIEKLGEGPTSSEKILLSRIENHLNKE
jgi:hypothetical protein